MPYIGNNHIAGDHTNNFKVLDDISSYTATFDGSASSVVDTTNNTIRVVEHRFIQGQRITYTNGSGGNIGGLTNGTAYFVIFDTASTFKLATSASNAANSVAINLSSVGTGSSHTLNAAFDGVNTKFKITYNGGTGARFNNATQLNIAINNVLQKPNVNSTTFTEGFAIEDNHKIVFKVAPTANDIFWGSIIANTLTTFDISDHKIDTFTGDGSTTEFTLSHTPANNESLMVTINGVLQHPSNASTARAYTLIASIIQFTAAPGVGDEIQVRHLGFAGATTADVSGFYGRTGNVVLTSNDHITTGDITSRNINSSGIITATTFDGSFSSSVGGSNANFTGIVTAGVFKGGDFDGRNLNISGIATFAGDVSIGGTLTYEDVTNIDSVGLITARNGAKIQTGTATTALVVEGDARVTGILTVGTGSITLNQTANTINVGTALTLGHTQGLQFHTQNLHSEGFEINNINASGIGTFADIHVKSNPSDTRITSMAPGALILSRNTPVIYLKDNLSDSFDASIELQSNELRFRGGGNNATSIRMQTTSSGVSFPQDIDVDGHTNLDNVSIAGVTTFAQKINLSDNFIRNCRGFNTGNEQARIVVKAGDNSAGGGLRIVEYYNDDTTLFSSEIANFYTTGIELKENVSVTGNVSAGAGAFTGNIDLNSDTNKLKIGAGDDFQLYHNGSNNFIETNNGDIRIKTSDSSGNLTFTAGGSNESARINSSGALMIGTTAAPSGSNTKLRVHFPQNTSSGEAIEISHDTNGADKVGAAFGLAIGNGGESTNAADLIIRTAINGSTSEKLRISSYGALLVGTTAPIYTGGDVRHEIRKDVARGYTAQNMVAHSHLLINNSNTGTDRFSSIGFRAGTGDGAIGFVYGNSANNADFVVVTDGAANGSEKFRITNAGKVGINLVGSDNTSPVRNLDIADSSGAILRLISTDDSLGANERVGEIEFYTDDDDSAHISSFIKAIADGSDAFGRRGTLTFGTRSDSGNASEKMRLDHMGRLGIGNNYPTVKLQITDTSATILRTEATANSGDALIQALGKDGSGNDRMIQMRTDAGASQYRIISSDTSYPLALCTGNAPRVLISGSSAATSIGGANTFNAMLTVQGDVSGQLFHLKATENTSRLMVSGNNSNGVEMNFYDDAGGQKGIIAASSTEFKIMAPGQTSMSFRTNDGYGTVERAAIDKFGTFKAHGFRRNSGTSNYNFTPLKGGYQGDDFMVGPTSFYQIGHRNSSSSSNYSAHELTMYRSGHWGQYTQCIVYALQFYYTHGLRIWHIDSGGNITLKHDYGGNTSISSGGQQLVGSGTHSGQNVYKYQITFSNGGTYQQVKWFVGHIGGGSNGHIGNSKSIAEADSWFQTRGGGIHFPNLAHESMQGSPFYQY